MQFSANAFRKAILRMSALYVTCCAALAVSAEDEFLFGTTTHFGLNRGLSQEENLKVFKTAVMNSMRDVYANFAAYAFKSSVVCIRCGTSGT